MQRHIHQLLAILAVVGPAILLSADEPKPIEGTMLMAGKTYKLAHVVAYEAKSSDETMLVVLASDRAIPIDKLKAALRENKGSDNGFLLAQPNVKVSFSKSGEVAYCTLFADNQTVGVNKDLSGELKEENGRVQGKANLALSGKALKRKFDLRFDVPLLTAAPTTPEAKPAATEKPGVSGVFKGNGKPAKIAFVSARRGEPYLDKPALVLIFSEKDHSREKLNFKITSGSYGSALEVSIHEEGGIFGCQVSHAAHQKRGFSSIGDIKLEDFELSGGQVKGRLTTKGEADAFGEKWEVDLKFVAPYAAAAKPVEKPVDKPVAADKSQPKPGPKPEPAKPTTKPEPGVKPQPVAAIHVQDLPIPKDATDVELKKLVTQITFKSPAPLQTLAADLTKKLAAQGWTTSATDLVNARTAILNRKRGDATLTLMLKPDGSGSQVTIFSKGLDWEEKEK